jgi:hypothetical protein
MRLSILRGSVISLPLAVWACADPSLPVASPSVPSTVVPSPPVPTPGASVAAAIAAVSGDNQPGKAGERLADPFVVRVTDAQGRGASGVAVVWSVATGAGAFGWGEDGSISRLSTTSNSDGLAEVFFFPTTLGKTSVTASVSALSDRPVTFTTDANVQVIVFVSWGWARFSGPDGAADVVVPVGTPVEWKEVYSSEPYTVTSMSVPLGAASFDSGILNRDDRFKFVPTVAGTWEYRDRLSDARARLTAR